MTYVEKMASKISIGMAFSSIKEGNPEGENFVEQIIADTKGACSIAITGSHSLLPHSWDHYMEAIRRAEVKEQEK